MIRSGPVPLIIQDKKKPCAAATSFTITSIIIARGPLWIPVKFRIHVEVRRNKIGILAGISVEVAAILEHCKTEVQVVVTRHRELHAIADLIREEAERWA